MRLAGGWARSRLMAAVGRRLGIGGLFAVALLPGLLAGAILFLDIYESEKQRLEQGALQIARALSMAMDRELAGIRGELLILAASPALKSGDLAAFHRQAQDILAAESVAAAIVLIAPSGQQLVNTLRPFGEKLPPTGHPEMLQNTFRTGQPAISDLFVGALTQRPFVALEVPVVREGRVVYALGMGIAAERLDQLLALQNLPPGWNATLLDSRGTVVARSLHPERHVGKTVPADLHARLARGKEGNFTGQTLDGMPSFIAFSRSDLSRWTVAVSMTQDVLYANLYRPLALAAVTVVAFFLSGLLLAWAFSRHLRHALKTLGEVTDAAAAGDLETTAPVSGPREIIQLAEQFNRMQAARRVTEAEQRRLNRTLCLLNESSFALLHADQEDRLLPEICRLIVETGGYVLAWVGFAEENPEKSVRPAAAWGGEQGYLEGIRVSWADNEFGRGPTGRAIRTGTTQVNQSFLANDALRPWREAAVNRGYQSSIALPLIVDGIVLGALMIYAAEPHAFAREEVSLLEKLANNLAFGIERLRTRVQLDIANRELQGFTYAASHDLKAPLTRIVSFSSLLERNFRDRLEGDGLLFLDFIRQNATRLMVLVEDLLQHAQIEQQVLHLDALDIGAAVQALLQEKAEDVREAGAEIRLDLPAARVHANHLALAQVLRNLLENALKYSSLAGRPVIEISGRVEGLAFRLWVRDNGIGFDMAYHDRIFEIFRRLHTYAEYPGSGVGLALVKKAMERMGGQVWADSRVGEGATFFIELPLAKDFRPEGPARPGQGAGGPDMPAAPPPNAARASRDALPA